MSNWSPLLAEINLNEQDLFNMSLEVSSEWPDHPCTSDFFWKVHTLKLLLVLVSSAVMIWIIWIIAAEFTRVNNINISNIHIIQIMGKRGEEVAVKETIEESAQGQRGDKKGKVGTDVKVMQVLQKLQAPQVKHLNQAASNGNKHTHL